MDEAEKADINRGKIAGTIHECAAFPVQLVDIEVVLDEVPDSLMLLSEDDVAVCAFIIEYTAARLHLLECMARGIDGNHFILDIERHLLN